MLAQGACLYIVFTNWVLVIGFEFTPGRIVNQRKASYEG
jgi:hypothetical protein